MIRLKQVLKIAAKLTASCLLAVMVLSVFVLVYSYAGIHLTNKSNSTDYKWRSNELKTTMTEGFAWLRMDENGFNNDHVPAKIDNLIMGSSHMEAANMMYRDCASGRLNQLLPLSTYNIGTSGHTIYRCVDNYKSAIEEFCPTEYSIIETSTVKLSVPDIQSVIEGKAKRIPSYDTGLIYYLQLIPAFRPIYNQFDNWKTLKKPAGGGIIQSFNSTDPEGYTETLHQFLSIVSDTAKENGIKPIIFYHPSEELNSDGSVTYNTDPLCLDCFASTCKELDIVFVDMTDSFAALYATEHQLAHGFINTAVGSGHLNKYGHHVIAEKLAEVIQGLEAK